MKKPRVYLDNCCFNRPFDDQSQILVRLETEAKIAIQEKITQNSLLLVWSYILEMENDCNPYYDRHSSIGEWRNLASEMVSESEDLIHRGEELERIYFRPKDALHLSCALTAHCDVFITTDKKILNKRDKVSGIRILDPIQFLNFLEDDL